MTRINVCAGCKVESAGIKTRVAVPHTCDKADKNYKEPETKKMGGSGKEYFLPAGIYYKIKVHQLIFATGTSTKYSIWRNQFLNGFKTKAGIECWFLNKFHYMDTNLPLQPYVWLHEQEYKKLSFV